MSKSEVRSQKFVRVCSGDLILILIFDALML